MSIKPASGNLIKLLVVENSSTVVALIQNSLAPFSSSIEMSIVATLSEARSWLDNAVHPQNLWVDSRKWGPKRPPS